MPANRARPSALTATGTWERLGRAMGRAAKLVGSDQVRGAVAWAVSQSVVRHYNGQLRDLHERGEGAGELRDLLKSNRDEELAKVAEASGDEDEPEDFLNPETLQKAMRGEIAPEVLAGSLVQTSFSLVDRIARKI